MPFNGFQCGYYAFLFPALTMSDTREIIFMEALKHVWRSMKIFFLSV